VDATRLDIAARVDGRVAEIPVIRGQDVAAGAVLLRIGNPETIAKLAQARAAKAVAEAQLANINAGTRPEVIAARKAAQERAQAATTLAFSESLRRVRSGRPSWLIGRTDHRSIVTRSDSSSHPRPSALSTSPARANLL
jgi:multidrug efflux pump subunit AcrA (membrane-fusion protein)